MNQRHFMRSSVAAAVSASILSPQAYGAALQTLLQVSSDINAVSGQGKKAYDPGNLLRLNANIQPG